MGVKFDPNKPFTPLTDSSPAPKPEKKRNSPKFDPTREYEVVQSKEGAETLGVVGDVLTDVGNAMDIPGAAVRSAIDGKFPQHMENIKNEGIIDASGMAPTGYDKTGGIVSGMGYEMATDPLTYGSLGTVPLAKSLIKRAMKKPLQKQVAKALAKIQPLTKTDLKSNRSTEVMAAQLAQEDLVKYIKNPSRLLEVLGGKRTAKEVTNSAGTMIKSTTKKKGKDTFKKDLIGEISQDLGEMMDDISYSNSKVESKAITDPVSAKLMEEVDSKTSAIRRSPEELARMEDEIFSIIDSPEGYSLSELYKIKKNIGKQISTPIYFQPTDKALSNSKETMMGIQKQIDDIIKDKLSGSRVMDPKTNKMVNAADYYELNNTRMHNLINVRDTLQMVPERELRNSDMFATVMGILTQGAVGGAAGGVISAVTDIPFAAAGGAIASGGYAAARQAGQAVTKNFPENAAKGMDLFQKAAPNLIPLAPQAAREGREIYRRPQSVENLPSQLIETTLPRTVDGIMENKKLFLAKAAQQAPDLFKGLEFLVNNRPEDLEIALPAMILKAPHLFDRDKYGRIDNKILDPSMQMKAREDIMESELTNTEKIAMIDKLNRTKILEDF